MNLATANLINALKVDASRSILIEIKNTVDRSSDPDPRVIQFKAEIFYLLALTYVSEDQKLANYYARWSKQFYSEIISYGLLNQTPVLHWLLPSPMNRDVVAQAFPDTPQDEIYEKKEKAEMPSKVYISGALTGVNNPEGLREFYERIADVCRLVGFIPYIPHLVSDPIANPTISDSEVYELDREQVSTSDLVIAYLGIPSFGVGLELEIAREQGVPVIALMEEGAKVSRMATGCPSITAKLRFTSYDDALRQLRTWLERGNESEW